MGWWLMVGPDDVSNLFQPIWMAVPEFARAWNYSFEKTKVPCSSHKDLRQKWHFRYRCCSFAFMLLVEDLLDPSKWFGNHQCQSPERSGGSGLWSMGSKTPGSKQRAAQNVLITLQSTILCFYTCWAKFIFLFFESNPSLRRLQCLTGAWGLYTANENKAKRTELSTRNWDFWQLMSTFCKTIDFSSICLSGISLISASNLLHKIVLAAGNWEQCCLFHAPWIYFHRITEP